jgi:HipA-like protein
MNGAYVGSWSLGTNGPDTLQYDLEWTRSEQGRPLSLSLPFVPGNLPHRGPHVRAWFENLLPDSKDIRERMARHYRAGSPNAFDLLSEAGRDCAGALQILPIGASSSGVEPLAADPLTEAQVADLLRATTTPQVQGLEGEHADLRISIAGAQEKTALLQMNGRWYLPRGATPTTHILKLPLGLIGGMKLDLRNSVENEWLCAQILAAYGLPVAACEHAVRECRPAREAPPVAGRAHVPVAVVGVAVLLRSARAPMHGYTLAAPDAVPVREHRMHVVRGAMVPVVSELRSTEQTLRREVPCVHECRVLSHGEVAQVVPITTIADFCLDLAPIAALTAEASFILRAEQHDALSLGCFDRLFRCQMWSE